MEVDWIKIREQKLRYATFGPEDAPRTLLVFNGIGASLETLKTFAGAFRDTRILSFDIPGVGESPPPLVPYRMPWIARLADRFLEALGIDCVDVAGVSWGGGAAQQFARDFPHRVHTLTLAATSAGFVMIPGNLRVIMKMATPKRYADPEHMLEIGPEIYGGQLRFNAELLEEHTDAMKTSTGRGYLYQLLAATGWTSWLFLRRLEMPVLVMMGHDDPIVPPVNGRMMMSRLPNARLEEIDCGHLFMLTDPKGTAHKIETFLMEHTVISGS